MMAVEAGPATIVPDSSIETDKPKQKPIKYGPTILVEGVECQTVRLISHKEVKKVTKELARTIVDGYLERSIGEVAVVTLLDGAAWFSVPLLKRMRKVASKHEKNGHGSVKFEEFPMQPSSYKKGTVAGRLEILNDVPKGSVAGKVTLIVDDIKDTGETLQGVMNHLRAIGAQALQAVTLLDKPSSRRKQGVLEGETVLTGITIPDKFVVGEGLDCAEQGRELKGIWEVILPQDSDPHAEAA